MLKKPNKNGRLVSKFYISVLTVALFLFKASQNTLNSLRQRLASNGSKAQQVVLVSLDTKCVY